MKDKAMAGRLREIANELDKPSRAECSGDITQECNIEITEARSTGWYYLRIWYRGNLIASQHMSVGGWGCEEGYEIEKNHALLRVIKDDC